MANFILSIPTGRLSEYIKLPAFKFPEWVLAPQVTSLKLTFCILQKAGKAEGLLHPLFLDMSTYKVSILLQLSACPLQSLCQEYWEDAATGTKGPI